ncbi:Cys-tRNA(Pro) deacylase, prolyl-tRNA editing enzyme YbaK/EbsC [Poseidonocella pacifica]|uniref:Cys-tRNA(Pro) deacylase, prolyl-tRNA editing enzyme YbaK/EbsC n=1 Tax=Poseidonocella pacifica TaxID=871651 RepID=A0A1I0VS32_9RHOB|nr:YbaK/EbsC family protein [Poseidonocella pacifica]SFA79171.1 Cys-tRNA(Pro) deacylase, prolyl-tRNA editing enzyme YbaK/EbsC [Poseidonocella pacifica]
MSKSLARVKAALTELGIDTTIVEAGQTRTAQEAADAVGRAVDQIVKSLIFRGETSGELLLFLTAGGNQVDPEAASAVAGEPLGKADATVIRAKTGFAIGGVAPVGHLSAIRSFLDPRLLDFAEIWAAAGTPRHVFSISPQKLADAISPQVTEFVI